MQSMQRIEFPRPTGLMSVCHWPGADSGAKKPVLHWAHANGFNGETYTPLLQPLADHFEVYASDARGHGFSTLPAEPSAMTGWDIYRDDLIPYIEHLADKAGAKIWLGGHSMGGCASVMVAAKRPDLVAGLLLADPVIIPSYANWLFSLYSRLRGTSNGSDGGGHMLMQMASKRRANWPDAATMQAAYTGRGAFATWQDGFLAAYLRGGVHSMELADEQGNQVTLACAPAWEAVNFKGPQVDVVADIKKLKVPFTLLMAEQGSTTRAVAAFEKQPLAKQIQILPGSSHFLPMEFPDQLRDALCQLAGIGSA
jgi:pimeloyl-ACP methyl ester carboxylesterase